MDSGSGSAGNHDSKRIKTMSIFVVHGFVVGSSGGVWQRSSPALWVADTKFACTEAESRRPDYEDIGDASERENDVPTMEELELCLKALKAGRACGPDQIPVEAYRGPRPTDTESVEKKIWSHTNV